MSNVERIRALADKLGATPAEVRRRIRELVYAERLAGNGYYSPTEDEMLMTLERALEARRPRGRTFYRKPNPEPKNRRLGPPLDPRRGPKKSRGTG